MEQRPKIIVVDDEIGICRNVEKILAKANYKVTHAVSAREALEKMEKESYALLISDMIMPEINGLELIKTTKEQWPLTKAVMMTAYASTDTAVKAIRIGALDYIPKPFTPKELRLVVEQALEGNLIEARISPEEKEAINIIDVDTPFDADEVAKVTGEAYAKTLGPSDMPVIEVKTCQPLENFCETGSMVCEIFKKLGATCKAGVKTSKCPQLAKKKRKGAKKAGFDSKKLIGIDQPFDYEEVVSVTGPEYVRNLGYDGVAYTPYEELKKNFEALKARNRIDVDMPFDRDEVSKVTGEEYTEQVSRSDVPVVEITASETLDGFCEMGSMVCDIFKKLGATCKAGTKTAKCPQLAKRKRAAAKKAKDTSRLIAVDQPFDYQEVIAATGPEYVQNLVYDGLSQMPYEQLKANYNRQMTAEAERDAKVIKLPRNLVDARILVIDDEVAVNNNIRKSLVKKDFNVDQALTRDEALEKIHGQAYDLILMDLKIPGVKGLELLKAATEVQPETKVIMITGYASIETAVEAARMGAIDYLPKPFTPTEIRDATVKALQLAA
jgi:DNA-binding response OmpR family regulator